VGSAFRRIATTTFVVRLKPDATYEGDRIKTTMARTALPWIFIAFAFAAVASIAAQTQPPQPDDTKKVDLPDGDGKKILETACTTCHGLEEVVKFKGYNTKDEWRDVVVTMVKYGAELKEPEIETLVEYLSKHFSRG
jgi:mono/diheme cytochrome c family protein